jgi:hypothetical protein
MTLFRLKAQGQIYAAAFDGDAAQIQTFAKVLYSRRTTLPSIFAEESLL